MSKQIFLSDFHMGPDWPLGSGSYPYEWLKKKNADTCANFINHLAEDQEVDKVVLLGDILDNNVCPIDIRPPTYSNILKAKKNENLMNSLKILSGNKQVFILRGNHDIDYKDSDILAEFPQINILRDNVYEENKLVALHGNTYWMWCAPDERDANKFKPLPIGYFLSRIGATKQTRNGNRKIPILEALVKGMIQRLKDPQSKNLIEKVITNLLKWSKIDINEEVVMPGNIKVTFSEVIENYRKLPAFWKKKYPKNSDQDYLLAWTVLYFQEWLKKDKKIFIAGHTHEQTIRPDLYLDNKKNGIYANCGKWCDKTPCFVESEEVKAAGHHHIQLKKWNDKTKKASLLQLFDPQKNRRYPSELFMKL
ncbi:MAG: hypothetical protein E4H23_01445 [Chrysiogenales bacterium]|nr:MAG: hypothetical protein E4H23_01445 [Chrysiogenales bacterium]